MRIEPPLTVPLSEYHQTRYSPNGVRLEVPLTAPITFNYASVLSPRRGCLERPLTEPVAHPETLNTLHSDDVTEDVAQPNLQDEHALLHPRGSAPPISAQQLSMRALEQIFDADAAALRGHYIIDSVLAVGGSSIIYRAIPVDLRASGALGPLALKVLRPELRNDPHAIERLHREFRFTAELIHPNVPRVFGIEQQSAILLMKMELLHGDSLAGALSNFQSFPITAAEVVSILKACGVVLSHAHEHDIVHTDIKPGNVWLTESRQVRVIDFGAAHSTRSTFSANGLVIADELPPRLATLAYASPQILAGDMPAPSDDVFSLACVAYELLVGRAEFACMSAAERAAARVYLKRPDNISELTWEVLQRGMHPQRNDRTPSVQELIDQLKDSLSGEIELEKIEGKAPATAALKPPATSVHPAFNPSAPAPLIERRDVRKYATIKPWQLAAAFVGVLLVGLIWFDREKEPILLSDRATVSTQQPSTVSATPVRKTLSTPTPFTDFADFADDPISRFKDDLLRRTSLTAQSFAQFFGTDALHTSEDSVEWRQFTKATTNGTPAVSTFASLAPRAVEPKERVSFDRATLTVSKRAVSAVLLIERTGSTRNPMNVKWRVIEGSAKRGVDFQGDSSGTVRFAANQAVRALYVPLKEHAAAGNRTFEVQLNKASSGSALGKIARVAVTIQDQE